MKIILTVIIVVLTMFCIQGYTREKPKEVYEFPESMPQPIRDEYLKLCEKGRVLYEINCAKCHNTIVKGKHIVPDFTEEQLGAYSIRVANPKHEENVSETNVSAEELALITTYLTYKKKNAK
jgi:mono/diheme cytochrome c family protein